VKRVAGTDRSFYRKNGIEECRPLADKVRKEDTRWGVQVNTPAELKPREGVTR